ncbi:UNVERIFIED_CONTAM: hypothetical protein RMT77_018561 [Armadillidium vulgare]
MDASNPTVANMYSAPSETKLEEEPLCSPSFQRALNDVKGSPGASNRTFGSEGGNPPSYSLKPLNGENRGRPCGRENFESEYSAYLETTAADVRRSSLTDVSIYPSPTIIGPPSAASEFCTIRRNPSTRPADTLRNNISNITPSHPSFPTNHPNGSVGLNHHTSTSSARPKNGSIQPILNRHSTYIPSNPSACSPPPPPPPYPRCSSNINREAVISPKSSPSQKYIESSLTEDRSTEAKYIFSPEAMLKPGTLV